MKEEIAERLKLLSKYVKFLQSYRKNTLEDLMNDYTLRGAVERYLELSIECCIDIAEMIISYENLKRPESYKDVILILGKEGIIPEKFAEKFSNAAGLRNILVHMYANIDINELYININRNLADFDKFAKYIAIYLDNKRRN